MLSNGGSSTYNVDFTSDFSRIERALDSGGLLSGSRDGILRVLTRLADSLAVVTNRRKTAILISSGIPEISRSVGMNEENRIPEFRDFIAASQRAHLAVYTVSVRYAFDLDNLVTVEGVEEREQSLDDERHGIAGLQAVAEGRAGSSTNKHARDSGGADND
jgi:hypothetical protein